MVDVQPAADDLLRGVVGAARILAAQQDALDELLLRDADVNHDVHLESVLGEDFVELLGLDRRAGEAVEDAPLGVAVLGHVVGNHVDDNLVGGQLAGLDVGLHAASQLGAAGNLAADDLARRDMLDAVVFLEALGLGALAAARRAE